MDELIEELAEVLWAGPNSADLCEVTCAEYARAVVEHLGLEWETTQKHDGYVGQIDGKVIARSSTTLRRLVSPWREVS